MSSTTPGLGAVHPISGRQFLLGHTHLWPDTEIVVPFNRRISDATGAVIDPPVSPVLQGGYLIQNTLQKLEIRDLVHDTLVTGVKALWAAGPGGNTAQLHVLGQDPFSWLTSQTQTITTVTETGPWIWEQRFGWGPEEILTGDRRFFETIVTPDADTALITTFEPRLPTRVLQSAGFTLHFRLWDGTPLYVDECRLLIVSSLRLIYHYGEDFRPSGATVLWPVVGDLELIAVDLGLTSRTETISVSASPEYPLLVYAVRYREARTGSSTTSTHTVLQPGRYRLSLTGHTSATPPPGLPGSDPVDWSVTQDFEVDYPETLRSYVRHGTLGDNRVFTAEPGVAWNPTSHGMGFPAYRDYYPLVRFVVPYMHEIFPKITMRLTAAGGTTDWSVTPQPNPDGDNALPQISKDWIAAHGGAVPPDEEALIPDALAPLGPVTLSLWFQHPWEGFRKLDEWNGYVSRFNRFAEHVAWAGTCLQTVYDASGRSTLPACGTVYAAPSGGISKWLLDGNRIDNTINLLESPSGLEVATPSTGPRSLIGVAIGDVTGVQPDTYPTELTAPLADWALPSALDDLLHPLDANSGTDFCRFAQATGARFNADGGDPLLELGNTVLETTVEAVVDGAQRPYALWLRTPEPLDWRRVSASLEVRHVTGVERCPTGYAHRHPLDLGVECLPGPDASSAFLVGSLAGVRTRLPRGEYHLSLAFDSRLPGLPPLRPRPSVGATPEKVTLSFLQPFGQDWPLPPSHIPIPIHLIDEIRQWLPFPVPPEPWNRLIAGQIAPEEFLAEVQRQERQQ